MSAPVALITGASSGLGRALAEQLVIDGYAVGLIARREPLLTELADSLTSQGGVAEQASVDVADRVSLEAAIASLRERLGPFDLVIANAGVQFFDRLDSFDAGAVEQTFAVNTLGVINTIGLVLPEMLKRGRGHIVGISSLGADRGLPGCAAYCASKAAISTYLDGIRVALKPGGIAVTTVCPGFVRTPMTNQNDFHMLELLEPDEAARRIVKALRRQPAVYRFPTSMSLVMRMMSFLPDWAVARLTPPLDPPEKS